MMRYTYIVAHDEGWSGGIILPVDDFCRVGLVVLWGTISGSIDATTNMAPLLDGLNGHLNDDDRNDNENKRMTALVSTPNSRAAWPKFSVTTTIARHKPWSCRTGVPTICKLFWQKSREDYVLYRDCPTERARALSHVGEALNDRCCHFLRYGRRILTRLLPPTTFKCSSIILGPWKLRSTRVPRTCGRRPGPGFSL